MATPRDNDLVIDMIAAAECVIDYVSGKSSSEFYANKQLQDAVLYQLAVLGEAASCVSKEYAAAHPEIPWRLVTGMRHRVIHGYDNVELDMVWETATESAPALLEIMRQL